MDWPPSSVEWAKHVAEASEDMVDSPTPPEPGSSSAKAVSVMDDEHSWQVLLQYKVLKVINLIRSGRLKPDVSRAERLSMMVNRDASNRDEDVADTWDEPDIGASDDDSEDLDVDEDLQSRLERSDNSEVKILPLAEKGVAMKMYFSLIWKLYLA
eukprot:s1200_g22.t1